MRVAVASKSCHWPWWAALRMALAAQGIEVVSTWLDWPPNHYDSEPASSEWREHAERCIVDATSCEVLLLYCAEGERQFGGLLETGAALGANRQVLVVSPHPWPFLKHHPRVRCFTSLEAAIAALLAMRMGEQARLAA
jgi:hypothetical protein